MDDGPDPLAAASRALGQGDFDAAVECAEVAAATGDAAALFLLGELRFMDERLDEAIDCWERTFKAARQSRDRRLAARVAMELAAIHVGLLGRPSAGNGWLEQARRQLDAVGPCVEWGYLELAIMACERLDVDDLLAATERALVLAAEGGDADLEARALSDQGLALVTKGRVRDGFARIDAALASIVAGEVSAMASGICFCSMLSACDRAGDVGRAAEWTDLVGQTYAPIAPRPIVMHTHCRVAYGSVLCASGRWQEAEGLLLAALGSADRPVRLHRALAVAHLANLRLDQGRVEDAAELLEPFADRLTSCVPLARLHLARQQVEWAVVALRRGLDELVGDAMQRASIFATLVEAEIARGAIDEAGATAAELTALAAATDAPTIAVSADRATARVLAATGDRPGARARLRAALARLGDAERPLLVGDMRLQLAELHAADDDTAAAIAEGRAALAAFDRLGSAPGRDRALGLLRSLGDRPTASRPQHADELGDLLTSREREVLDLVARGLTNAEIADRLYISKKTTEHHVGRMLMKLGVRSRAEAAALAVRLGTTAGLSGRE